MGGRGKTKGKYRLCVTEEFKAARVPLIACQPNNRIKFEQSLGQHHLRREEAALMPLLPPEAFVWPEELLVQPLPAGEIAAGFSPPRRRSFPGTSSCGATTKPA